TCSVIVADTDSGTKSAPGGSVTFTSSGTGTFTGNPCTLTPGTTSSSCQVTYTPTAGAGTHTIKASYSANDSRHTNSADTLGVGLTATKRTTSTGVICSANPITYGGSSTCTATVTDTDAGTKSAPSGTVIFDNGTASGTFSSPTCSLVTGST